MSNMFREALPSTDLTPDEWKRVPKNTRRVIMEKLGDILVGESPNPLNDQGLLVAAMRRIINQAPFQTLSNPYLANCLDGYSRIMIKRDQEREGQLLAETAEVLKELARPKLRIPRPL